MEKVAAAKVVSSAVLFTIIVNFKLHQQPYHRFPSTLPFDYYYRHSAGRFQHTLKNNIAAATQELFLNFPL
jgi:hypothetical protein